MWNDFKVGGLSETEETKHDGHKLQAGRLEIEQQF
jgi:hypothetical protein